MENRFITQSYKICYTIYILKSLLQKSYFSEIKINNICNTTLINMHSLTSIFLDNEIYHSNYQKILRSAIFIVFEKAVLYRKY